MINSANQFVLKTNNKIVEKVGVQYRTVGLISEYADSIDFYNGHLNVYYDSDHLDTVDRHAPIISLADVDDSGNLISWSYNFTNDAQSGRNIRIITGAGNKPPYTISPFLYDSSVVTATSIINIKGTIPGGNPRIYDDSGYMIDLPLELSYLYCNDYFITKSYTTREALRFVDMGTPAIRYIKSLNSSISLNTDPSGLHFSDSGEYVYIMGDNGDVVKQYDLITPYDLTTAIDSGNNSFTTHSYQSGSKRDLYLNPTGDRMFLLSRDPDVIYQYDLDSAGQVRSAQFKSTYYESTFLDRDISFSPDGKYLYSLADDNRIYQYELYEPFRISSAGRNPSKNYNFGNFVDVETSTEYRLVIEGGVYWRWRPVTIFYYHNAYPQAFCFSQDGSNLYEVTGMGFDQARLRRFTLSTPWDISTLTVSQSRDHQIGIGDPSKTSVNNSKQNGVWGIRISNDGTKLFLMSREGDTNRQPRVLQYNLPTPFTFTGLPNTLTYANANATFYLTGVPYQRQVPIYNSLGTIIGYTTENSGWNNYVNGFDFNSDGSKFYITNHQKVFEYSSSDFNISGSTLLGEYPLSQLNTSTKSLKLSSNGQYVYTQNSDIIYQHDFNNGNIGDLSLSYTSKILDISSKESSPEGMVFTKDGTKMYIIGTSNRNIHEYILSTPFEIHSAVFNSTLSTSNLLSSPKGLALNPSETVLYIVSASSVYSIDIKSPFSSSTPTGDVFNVTYNVRGLNGIRWNNDGKEFSVIGTGSLGIDTYETKNIFAVKPL